MAVFGDTFCKILELFHTNEVTRLRTEFCLIIKNKERPPKLISAQADETEKFVCSSREDRRSSYLEIAFSVSLWEIGDKVVKN